ncbi:hypothetical protein LH464_05355 [Neorhizobium sp. T786]|nr:hypothetical protein [Neorhizobium xiangyangii]
MNPKSHSQNNHHVQCLMVVLRQQLNDLGEILICPSSDYLAHVRALA